MERAQEVETTEKNMITEKVDAVRDKVKRARDNLRVKVHMHNCTYNHFRGKLTVFIIFDKS